MIERIAAGIEYSRPFRPKWNGTAGLIFQVSCLNHFFYHLQFCVFVPLRLLWILFCFNSGFGVHSYFGALALNWIDWQFSNTPRHSDSPILVLILWHEFLWIDFLCSSMLVLMMKGEILLWETSLAVLSLQGLCCRLLMSSFWVVFSFGMLTTLICAPVATHTMTCYLVNSRLSILPLVALARQWLAKSIMPYFCIYTSIMTPFDVKAVCVQLRSRDSCVPSMPSFQ